MAAATITGTQTIRWGDRLALRFAATTFTVVAVLVFVGTVVAAVSYVQLAEEASETSQRYGPAALITAVGSVLSLCLYGLGRVCRAVVRLCPEAVHPTRF